MIEHIKELLSHKPVITALIILFGAIVHATLHLKISREKNERFTFLDFIILVVIASFAGMVSSMLASYVNPDIVNLASAIGAVMGVVGINFVARKLLSLLGIKDPSKLSFFEEDNSKK